MDRESVLSMPVLPLEVGIIYGPVRSRRLGLSLGINLLPASVKVCSYDCIYCHYGATHIRTLRPQAVAFPSVTQVVSAVRRWLARPHRLDCLTFSGNGEPTLHPDFPVIVRQLREVRDALCPEVRLALFSNGSTVNRPEVREALAQLDLPILKLDAGDACTFERINRPAPELALDALIEGMARIPTLILQSVLIDGDITNAQGPAFDAWVNAIARVHPTRVQIYSTEYPVPEAGVLCVPPYILTRIAADVAGRTGVPVEAAWV